MADKYQPGYFPPPPGSDPSFGDAMSQVNVLPPWMQGLMGGSGTMPVTGGTPTSLEDMYQIPQTKMQMLLTGLGLAAGSPQGQKVLGKVAASPATQAVSKWFGGLFPRQYTPTMWNEATQMYERGEPRVAPGVTAWRAQRAPGEEPFSDAPRFGTYFATGTEGSRSVGGYLKPEGSYMGPVGGPNLVKAHYTPQNPFKIYGPHSGYALDAYPSNVALEKVVGSKQFNQIFNDVDKVVEGHYMRPSDVANVNQVLIKHGLSSAEAREVTNFLETHEYSPYQLLDAIGNKKLKDLGYDSIMAQHSRHTPRDFYTGKPEPYTAVRNEFVVLGRPNASKFPRPPE